MINFNLLAPIGAILFGICGIILAYYTDLHGIWIHISVVTPWSVCAIWTWRWSLNMRSKLSTAGLTLFLIFAAVTGELVQFFLPIHTVDIYGVMRNIEAMIIGFIIIICIERGKKSSK